MDIFVVFSLLKTARLSSQELLQNLVNLTDRPWTELKRGKAINEWWLARQLRPYGVRPRTMRMGPTLAKGYLVEDFAEVFRRYIPKSEIEGYVAELQERSALNGVNQ